MGILQARIRRLEASVNVRFSNRLVWVKRFSDYPPLQCRCRLRARASLRTRRQGPSSMGFENEGNNLWVGLAAKVTAGPSGHAISAHPSSRKGHHSTARWSSRFLLSGLILHCHAAAASCRVQRNSVPSTQIRCMITASRRASATIAFFVPRRLAICIAQALSQDHRFERTSRIWAAS